MPVLRCFNCRRPIDWHPRPGHVPKRIHDACKPCARQRLTGRRKIERLLLPEDGIIDDIAVERLTVGDHAILVTRREVTAAITILRRRGRTVKQIADTLDMNERTIQRMFAEAA